MEPITPTPTTPVSVTPAVNNPVPTAPVLPATPATPPPILPSAPSMQQNPATPSVMAPVKNSPIKVLVLILLLVVLLAGVGYYLWMQNPDLLGGNRAPVGIYESSDNAAMAPEDMYVSGEGNATGETLTTNTLSPERLAYFQQAEAEGRALTDAEKLEYGYLTLEGDAIGKSFYLGKEFSCDFSNYTREGSSAESDEDLKLVAKNNMAKLTYTTPTAVGYKLLKGTTQHYWEYQDSTVTENNVVNLADESAKYMLLEMEFWGKGADPEFYAQYCVETAVPDSEFELPADVTFSEAVQ